MEFFHAPTGHYFMTGSADTSGAHQCAGRICHSCLPGAASPPGPGNKSRPANAVAVQRFFNPATSSHVFTSSASDIALLRSLPIASNRKASAMKASPSLR